MNKEEFASRLHGNEKCNEISMEDITLAKKYGFIVIYGYEDPETIVVTGAVKCEVCESMTEFTVHTLDDVLLRKCSLYRTDDDEDAFNAIALKEDVNAVWNHGEIPVKIETKIPHADFFIWDFSEFSAIYCRGIVIDRKDLRSYD